MTALATETQLQALRARILVERYGATRMVLFGSLARGDFDEGSDINIAADNLAGVRLYRAMGEKIPSPLSTTSPAFPIGTTSSTASPSRSSSTATSPCLKDRVWGSR
ncbi:MAG: hypothetical protein CUN48_13190 [Candidatus Thermofonsia Clade 3 bacterium]|jgi:hypothetical protein|uniref:Polymerase nucleotidyl transferase domain-containing protein n=1 Tax=Candidatus Thermofonsia Clade 3 bacterium TaxID=2364212 RepID=A0A2M8Q9T9_9CHLR|nr:nucleotidyltransferase domain-containing protein [Candidatus Roseilinea sp. NK_OTU-006]PJF46557.1 MAG: hypothetical protein CUN48_13190 [Candidatus Thermofonsia Clade 3 bacterium]